MEQKVFFGTEQLLGYCGGFHHWILLFVITLVSLVFAELLKEVPWIEWRL